MLPFLLIPMLLPLLLLGDGGYALVVPGQAMTGRCHWHPRRKTFSEKNDLPPRQSLVATRSVSAVSTTFKTTTKMTASAASSWDSGGSESQQEESPAVAAGEAAADDDDTIPGASLASGVFGVTKAMLGTGILALPGGLAATSDFPSMLWPANLLLLVTGAFSAYTFSLYGRLAWRTETLTIDAMWAKVFGSDNKRTPNNDSDSAKEDASVTQSNSLPISVANFAYCYSCCLTFLLVIADALTSLVPLAFGAATSTTGAAMMVPWWASRPALLLTVAGGCLWPLCNMASLQALAPVSLIGVLGCLVTTAFVVWRSPLVAAGKVASAAQFSTYNRVRGPAPLVLFSMGCVAMMAHFSAPAFLESLLPKSRRNGKAVRTNGRAALRKFTVLTVLSYAAVALLDAICLTAGFLTFGGASAGIILNNYAATDRGAAASRFLTAVSVGGSFPILLDAARSSVADLLGHNDRNDNLSQGGDDVSVALRRRRRVTAVLLTSLTAIAMVVRNAGFVVSLNGALMGTAIMYIFPALMFLRATGQPTPQRGMSRLLRLERLFCRFLVGFGTAAAVVGAVTTVLLTYFPFLLT